VKQNAKINRKMNVTKYKVVNIRMEQNENIVENQLIKKREKKEL
jgi:hypothetical protein